MSGNTTGPIDVAGARKRLLEERRQRLNALTPAERKREEATAERIAQEITVSTSTGTELKPGVE